MFTLTRRRAVGLLVFTKRYCMAHGAVSAMLSNVDLHWSAITGNTQERLVIRFQKHVYVAGQHDLAFCTTTLDPHVCYPCQRARARRAPGEAASWGMYLR